MKKLFVGAMVALLGLAFTMPAWAFETQFGGYWRTRAYSMNNFTGEDESEASDKQLVDTRTRLYFTAILNDNLKLVNKFEFDTVWGDDDAGDFGADGHNFELKNSYADFNMGAVNAKVGIQGVLLSRGFLLDEDVSGAVITYNGNGFTLPFIWTKSYEGSEDGGKDSNDSDVDYYAIAPTFDMGSLKLNPVFMYVTSDDADAFANQFAGTAPFNAALEDADLYILGLNADMDFGCASAWFTGLYEMGTIDYSATVGPVDVSGDLDVKAFILALGGNVDLNGIDLHGQMFYASGDDEDEDYESFYLPGKNNPGQSYYWAELMGFGIFDDMGSNGSPEDKIQNITAFNLGASVKPAEKLTLSCDLWYAQLTEEDSTGEEDLGTEIDLRLTYELLENLTLDVVGAYLFAGDRTNCDANGNEFADDANPYELGAQLSLSF